MKKATIYNYFIPIKWGWFCVFIFCIIYASAQNSTKVYTIEKIQEAGLDIGTVNRLNKLSIQLLSTDLDKALIYAEKSLKIADSLGFEAGKAYSLENIGVALREKGSYQKAMGYFEKSLKIFENRGDKNKTAAVLRHIGVTLRLAGDEKAAMQNYLKALEIYELVKNKKGTAIVLNSIGIILMNKADYKGAMDYFFQSLRIYESLGLNDEMALVFQNIGNIYFYQNHFEKALIYYQKALEIQEKTGDKGGIASNLNAIGMIYQQEKKFDKAIEYSLKALLLREELGDEDAAALILMNLGVKYADREDYAEAEKYYSRALNIYKKLDNPRGLAIGYCNLGYTYLQLGKTKEAIATIDSSSVIAQKVGDIETLKTNYLNLSEVYKVLKDYKKTYGYYQRYTTIKDSLSNTEAIASIYELERKYTAEKKEKEIAELNIEKERQKVLLGRQNLKIIMLLTAMICMIVFGVLLNSRNKFKQRALLHDKTIKQQELILKTTISVQEQERKKIATDLHDNIGYLLTALRLSFERITKDILAVFPSAKAELEAVSKLLDTTYSEIHSISHQMALPMSLEKLGLIPAMEEMLNVSIAKTEIKFEFEHFQISERFTEDIEIAIYRITQELVNNVVKHSRASTLTIQLIKVDQALLLLVEDNGIGFNSDEHFNGLGLTNIKNRVDSVKGTFDISSRSGTGTTVTIKVPLT